MRSDEILSAELERANAECERLQRENADLRLRLGEQSADCTPIVERHPSPEITAMSKAVEDQCLRQLCGFENRPQMTPQDVASLNRVSFTSTENQIVLLPIRTLLQSFLALYSSVFSQQVYVDLRDSDAPPTSRSFGLDEPELIRVVGIL